MKGSEDGVLGSDEWDDTEVVGALTGGGKAVEAPVWCRKVGVCSGVS